MTAATLSRSEPPRARGEESGLSFWLAFVESEGGLCEDVGDHNLVLLPPALRQAMSLPEEMVVTADPGVAREDGALLVAPGHPLLQRAADAVIERGDVGWAHLPWPDGPPQVAAVMEERARELVEVGHGKLEVVGQPVPAYLPVLRLGVLVTYRVSLEDSFLEREEVMVDATTGLLIPPAAARSLVGGGLEPAAARDHRTLAARAEQALESAHRLLEPRLAARCQSLGRQSQPRRREELDRAEGYFQAALESIAHRRARATAERQALLDDQARATEQERQRRISEIYESFRPSYVLRPFRLHMLGLPVVVVPVDVRRGQRRYPFRLVWVPTARTFAASRCPACSSVERLVAGKGLLGCRACLDTSIAPPVAGP
ncbi:MAG: hypothetical protein ACRDY2_05770 [Acidimicrobiales bacterium]